MGRAFPIKGRYVVAMTLMPFLYLPGVDWVYHFMGEGAEWYWYDIAYIYYYQVIFAALLMGLSTYHKVNWSLMLASASHKEFPAAIKLTVFIFIFSIAAAYALFYPLSFVWPKFVIYWFIDLPPVIYSSQYSFPVTPNILSFISLVVLAPVIEEFAFRGVLLHRWSNKWGINRAILFSSVLFGLVHPDPIGAIAFGMAMSVLYLKTQTLVVPVICHALNNLLVWLIEAGYIAMLGSDYVYTLEDFQSDWAVGLVCGIISIIWAYAYLQGKKSQKVWRLPEI